MAMLWEYPAQWQRAGAVSALVVPARTRRAAPASGWDESPCDQSRRKARDRPQTDHACFIVKDYAGMSLADVYLEDESGRRAAAKLLTRDEARRNVANVAAARSRLVLTHSLLRRGCALRVRSGSHTEIHHPLPGAFVL